MPEMLPYALLGMALLVFGWVMFRMMIRRGRRGRQPSPQRQVTDTRSEMDGRAPRKDRSLRDAPSDVLRWQVEMNETARDLRGELDSRIQILNATIRLADQRIAEMKQLLKQVEQRDSQS